MPGPISINKIITACNQGIIQAHNNYKEMSGGSWLWYAPEYFITTFIALEIHKQPGAKRVIVEHGAKQALIDAGAAGKGKFHPNIRSNGRVDILLSWANGKPRGIIEVKNRIFNKSQYENDIKRIKHILLRKKQENSIQFGIFTFYTVTRDSSQRSADKNSDLRKETILENMKNILGYEFTVDIEHKKFTSESGYAVHTMSVLIKPTSNN